MKNLNIVKFRLKTYCINLYRRSFIKVDLNKKKNQNFDMEDIKCNFNKKKEIINISVRDKGYCYLENFLNNEFYLKLKENYPSKEYFVKSKNPIKYFDFGYIYLTEKKHLNDNKLLLNLKTSKVLEAIYKYLLSSNFENQVNKIFKQENKKLVCKNIISSYASSGGYLIPHKDNIAEKRSDLNVFFIYFIDGLDEDPLHSGGTSIFKDNEANQALLSPKSLKNTLLIYDPTKDFFHGFKHMKKGSFRKAITFEFYSEDLKNN